jgi:uncharacterized membrane protein YheB (UPF0754 family)
MTKKKRTIGGEWLEQAAEDAVNLGELPENDRKVWIRSLRVIRGRWEDGYDSRRAVGELMRLDNSRKNMTKRVPWAAFHSQIDALKEGLDPKTANEEDIAEITPYLQKMEELNQALKARSFAATWLLTPKVRAAFARWAEVDACADRWDFFDEFTTSDTLQQDSVKKLTALASDFFDAKSPTEMRPILARIVEANKELKMSNLRMGQAAESRTLPTSFLESYITAVTAHPDMLAQLTTIYGMFDSQRTAMPTKAGNRRCLKAPIPALSHSMSRTQMKRTVATRVNPTAEPRSQPHI